MFWRPVDDADLQTCLDIEPRHLGQELVGRERALAAWHWLLRSPSFHAAAIEADVPIGGHSILGFGAAAFVSSDFVDAELENPRPGLNARIVASIAKGEPVVLDDDDLRRCNTHDGLSAVNLCGAFRQEVLDRDQTTELLAVMGMSFFEVHAGYFFRRIIGEAIAKSEIKAYATSEVFRLVQSYDELDDPQWGRERALYMVDGREVGWASVAFGIFQKVEPVLRLRDADQRLLLTALSGLTDEELAQKMNLQVGAVKKRWAAIFDRISDARPDLFSECSNTGNDHLRGKQRRHHVLAYVRKHPEELRPFEYSRAVHRNRPHRIGIPEDASAG